MASPEVIDFDNLLAPIAGDNPAGVDLREDFAPDSVYRRVRAARAEAREAERRLVYEDQGGGPRSNAGNWQPILDLTPQAIAERSKDLELAALLTEALVREHGFAGLRDGFRLARELAERFWDGLYPMPDEEGVVARVAPLTGLNGEDGEGLLIAPIGKVPITQRSAVGPFNMRDYQRAREIDAIADPDKRARRLEQPGVVTTEMFETAVSATTAEFFTNLLEDLEQCADEFGQLCEVLEEKCGQDESGYSEAPPSSNIRGALAECRETVEAIARDVLGLDAPEDEAAGGASTALGPAQMPGAVAANQVHNREEAFRALLRVADFFKRTEPHSPVSYALEQAVRWGKMPLPDLLGELITDSAAREQLFKLVGIKPPEVRE
jgi:type VI secretion system protein ImpA